MKKIGTNTPTRRVVKPLHKHYQENISYAEAAKIDTNQPTGEDNHILSKFLEEFKSTFN